MTKVLFTNTPKYKNRNVLLPHIYMRYIGVSVDNKLPGLGEQVGVSGA